MLPSPPVVFHGATVQRARLCRRANRAIARRVDATFGADKATKHQANKLPAINVRTYLQNQPDSLAFVRPSKPDDTHRLTLLCLPKMSSLGV